MEPTKKPNRFAGARVPVTLVLLFLVSWMLYDAIDRDLGYAAAIDAALWLVLFAILVVPEIRKRR